MARSTRTDLRADRISRGGRFTSDSVHDLLIITKSAGPSIALKIFFTFVELLILCAGVYFYRNRAKFFSHKTDEGDTYAAANLRMVMVILIWIHSVIVGAIMIFEV